MPARKRKSLRPVHEPVSSNPFDLLYHTSYRNFFYYDEIIEEPNEDRIVFFREYFDEVLEPHEYSVIISKETYQQVEQLLKDHSEVDTDDTNWTTLEQATVGFSLYVLEKEWDNEPKGAHEQDMFRELSNLTDLLKDCGYIRFWPDSASITLEDYLELVVSTRKDKNKTNESSSNNEIEKIKFFTRDRNKNKNYSFEIKNSSLIHIINLVSSAILARQNKITKEDYLSDRHHKQEHARVLIKLTEEHLSFKTTKVQYEFVYSLMGAKGFSFASKERFDYNKYDVIRKLGSG